MNDLLFIAKYDNAGTLHFTSNQEKLELIVKIRKEKGINSKSVVASMNIYEIIDLFYFINKKFIGLNISMEDILNQLYYE